ncbi:S1C family serine protease [Thioclava sp. JM3]|uniref:S1C family serine protease n=1 Tax=Thioclava sp. JM3 TaxID=1973004 RepID=UPI001F0AB451|nr:S1C family serine protease [Thioclava sp. JM3]
MLSFDGTEIKEARDLTRAVASTAPDTASTIVGLRKGERMTLDVTLANRAIAQDA